MKHDVKIMGRKEKNITTLNQYFVQKDVLTPEEKERRKERERVAKLLTSDYYTNKNAN
jgi:hypothetical protein